MPDRPMPSFAKSPPELVERFAAILDRYPDAERKKMFGYPAAFVAGNMATGLFADHWVVRIPDEGVDEARKRGASTFEVMPGKAMKSFLVIPPADVQTDAAIVAWVELGLVNAASLPPKESGAKKRK
jgi:hypothetical protein